MALLKSVNVNAQTMSMLVSHGRWVTQMQLVQLVGIHAFCPLAFFSGVRRRQLYTLLQLIQCVHYVYTPIRAMCISICSTIVCVLTALHDSVQQADILNQFYKLFVELRICFNTK